MIFYHVLHSEIGEEAASQHHPGRRGETVGCNATDLSERSLRLTASKSIAWFVRTPSDSVFPMLYLSARQTEIARPGRFPC